MIDRTDAEEQLLEVAEDMMHDESGLSRDCRKCQLLDAESWVREGRVELEAEIESLQEETDRAALDAITVEEQQADLERLQDTIEELEAELDEYRWANDVLRDRIMAETEASERLTQRITDLEMDRAMFEVEVERLRAQVEEHIDNAVSLRSQRNALLAANEELQDVIRQLV